MMRMKLLYVIMLMMLAMSLPALSGCDCGDDDDDDDTGDDDTADDDTGDDDTGDDDTGDDDTGDDDTGDDDTGDDDTDICDWDNYNPLILDGKDFLAEMEPDSAYDSFYDAREVCPDIPDAKIGILLADLQWYLRQVKIWADYLADWTPTEKNKGVGSTFQDLARMTLIPINQEMFALADELRTDHADFRFFVPEFPLFIDGDYVVLEGSGEWDIADVTNLHAFARLWESFCRFLIAPDLTFNWALFALNPAPPGAPIEELIHHYSGVVLDLLADPEYPDFLKWDDEDGPDNFAQGAIEIGQAQLELIDAFEQMKLEIDPQQDDVAGYVDVNGNGVYDEGEPSKLPYFGEMGPNMQITWELLLETLSYLGPAFLDSGPEDVSPLPNWFNLGHLEWLLQYLDFLFPGFELPHIPLPIGWWFYHPLDDGLRTYTGLIAQMLYDFTTPEVEEVLP